MNVLVIQCSAHPRLSEALDAVARGAAKSGAAVVRTTPDDNPVPDGFDTVFIGFHVSLVSLPKSAAALFSRGNWNGAVVGILATHAAYGKKPLAKAEALARARGARHAQTLNLKLEGLPRFLGRGRLSETQLARAEAFGERTVRVASGRGAPKSQEKTRIAGYHKPRAAPQTHAPATPQAPGAPPVPLPKQPTPPSSPRSP